MCYNDLLRPHEKPLLDARALGDLSAFPALRVLSFAYCEVLMCMSMLGAVRHASLVSLIFRGAYPAPGCALTLLQLSQTLRGLGRGTVFKLEGNSDVHMLQSACWNSGALPPCYKFKVAMEACGM